MEKYLEESMKLMREEGERHRKAMEKLTERTLQKILKTIGGKPRKPKK